MNHKFIIVANKPDPSDVAAEIEAIELAIRSLDEGRLEEVREWLEALLGLARRKENV